MDARMGNLKDTEGCRNATPHFMPRGLLRIFILAAVAAGCIMGCHKRGADRNTPVIRVDEKQFNQRAREALAGRRGAIVALDPRTGRVLALVNPADALETAYPVGSAFKPATVAAAVQRNIAAPTLRNKCEGRIHLAGHDFPCWLRKGHGLQDMPSALAVSCNVYFYRLGARFHGPELARTARQFGFGEKTGYVDANQKYRESAGEVPDNFPPVQVVRFAAGDTQRLRATPMQMAVFAAALANGGRVLTPMSMGGVKVRRHIQAPRGLDTARSGMKMCVTLPGGTCHSLENMGHTSAGKTGTARHDTGFDTHAWFIGWSPADKPEAAIAVFLHSGRGPSDAVPLARQIFQAYFRSKR